MKKLFPILVYLMYVAGFTVASFMLYDYYDDYDQITLLMIAKLYLIIPTVIIAGYYELTKDDLVLLLILSSQYLLELIPMLIYKLTGLKKWIYIQAAVLIFHFIAVAILCMYAIGSD